MRSSGHGMGGRGPKMTGDMPSSGWAGRRARDARRREIIINEFLGGNRHDVGDENDADHYKHIGCRRRIPVVRKTEAGMARER